MDDYEFQVYLDLKKWRLQRCRELDIEPYKVFQNRTLCEAVRRIRNHPAWGTTAAELTECWGVGPRKVEEGGYAWELAERLHNKANEELLEKSLVISVEKTENDS